MGHLKVYYSSDNTDEKHISLTLDEAFIDTEAIADDLCSLRVTEFGDMRSFLSADAEPNSYGTSEEMVEHFDCIETGVLANATRTYTL